MNYLYAMVLSLMLLSLANSQACITITEPNNDQGNCHIGTTSPGNKCCWVKYELGQSLIEYCQEIKNDETTIKAEEDKLIAKNYKNIDIQCSTHYLAISFLFSFVLFLL